ncbi:thymidylate synthase [Synechococcus sp. SYN20]|uniref:FAD-dependent thymidylate synthase n=1 Tax=Synechococcus sp. SYN20 TaxID=1050714 RepID=UPI001645469F|nr:FAD-dependent thymidylate synthase [Synechococcus sp. SYN20]QNJ25902.1 thymidylate synthase [Synechococcus sp. SYN20]
MQRDIHTASLISVTPHAEKQIAYCARVSSKNQENESIAGLLRFCMREGHFSIFEQAHMTVQIETTPEISRQILRHHDMRFQEFSQRYQDVSELGGWVVPNLRRQDDKNRQSSHDDLDPEFKHLMERKIETLYGQAFDLYEYMLSQGVAKETARSILPIGGTRTKLYATTNLRTWIFYLKNRTHESTQLEHRLVANAIKDIFEVQFPTIFEAAFG